MWDVEGGELGYQCLMPDGIKGLCKVQRYDCDRVIGFEKVCDVDEELWLLQLWWIQKVGMQIGIWGGDPLGGLCEGIVDISLDYEPLDLPGKNGEDWD